MSDKFYFFWFGPFSQWHLSDFIIDNIRYNCAEQYMMAEKARLFNDLESLNKIMLAKTPKEQKALGRKVKNFDENIWSQNLEEIIFKANLAKFTQNLKLKRLILNVDKILVEASPYDRIYGIGLKADDPRAQDQKTWLGENKLGFILMKVKDKIKELEKTKDRDNFVKF